METKAVLFDLDGTLVDSALDFIAILQAMRSERGMPPMATSLIRQRVSAGAAAMVGTALELEPESAMLETHKADFLQRYAQNCALHSRPFPGVEALLDCLERHAIAWGVVTNKPQHFAVPVLQQLGLHERLSVLVCPEQAAAKPAPDMLLLACKQLGLSAHEVVYLGDDQRDIQAATAAGMPCVAVGYGYHGPEDDPRTWQADYFIARPEQLLCGLQSTLLTQLES